MYTFRIARKYKTGLIFVGDPSFREGMGQWMSTRPVDETDSMPEKGPMWGIGDRSFGSNVT